MSDQDYYSGTREVAVNRDPSREDADGLVLKWRRRGDTWEGLVSHEVDGRVVTEWRPALAMGPLNAATRVDDVPDPA